MKIFNTLTKQKERLKPIVGSKLGIYVCGVTIYDRLHLGHARTFTAFDAIVRYLRNTGLDVTYVRNITDIDDKIIDRAKENGVTPTALTNKYIEHMNDDFAALNLMRPDVEPKVSEHIPEIIEMIETLITKGFAYTDTSGDVLFNIAKFDEYGKLSGQNIEMIGSQFNERDLIAEQIKSNEHDFVLWKLTNDEGFNYASPFGQGRPGWHIECSAMSKKHLGSNFDIHGGGSDLTFPHHENEISQSVAANGTPYANAWMHTGMITVDGVKMSKSLGNFITIEQVLKDHDAEAVRLFLLSSHYRSNMDYSASAMEQAHKTLERVYRALENSNVNPTSVDIIYYNNLFFDFDMAMLDDFNTPLALSVIYRAAKHLNSYGDTEVDIQKKEELYLIIKNFGNKLGLFTRSPQDFFADKNVITNDAEALISARDQARKDKNWAEADRIRDLLAEMDVSINDKKVS